ncbi:hypothetical protein DPMN_054670 [Dreissena polymorpha]|uniref:Uncharacterized protein n=1 Tax=Dreissena polymorpha TaxID=45954 RepID=A0A9D4HRU6_DREPO|nr:hypothetical protein DPMN_054670 [Dreissena polymorpha]
MVIRFQHGAEDRRNQIRCSPNFVTLTRSSLEKCLDVLLNNLSERFTDNGTASHFSIFDPSKLSFDDELLTYGNEEIHQLAEFYGRDDSPLSVNPDN